MKTRAHTCTAHTHACTAHTPSTAGPSRLTSTRVTVLYRRMAGPAEEEALLSRAKERASPAFRLLLPHSEQVPREASGQQPLLHSCPIASSSLPFPLWIAAARLKDWAREGRRQQDRGRRGWLLPFFMVHSEAPVPPLETPAPSSRDSTSWCLLSQLLQPEPSQPGAYVSPCCFSWLPCVGSGSHAGQNCVPGLCLVSSLTCADMTAP
jgi:hypothetical protein